MTNNENVKQSGFPAMLEKFKMSHGNEDWILLHVMADYMEDQGKNDEAEILHLMAVNQICPYQNDTWFNERDMGAWFNADNVTAEGHPHSNIDPRIISKMDRQGVENYSQEFIEYMSYEKAVNELLRCTILVHEETRVELWELLPRREDLVAKRLKEARLQTLLQSELLD